MQQRYRKGSTGSSAPDTLLSACSSHSPLGFLARPPALDLLQFDPVRPSPLPPLRSLEKVLEKMSKDWEGVEFRITEYKDTGTFVMGGADEVQALLDDQVGGRGLV